VKLGGAHLGIPIELGAIAEFFGTIGWADEWFFLQLQYGGIALQITAMTLLFGDDGVLVASFGEGGYLGLLGTLCEADSSGGGAPSSCMGGDVGLAGLVGGGTA